jgi:hypothetical protein
MLCVLLENLLGNKRHLIYPLSIIMRLEEADIRMVCATAIRSSSKQLT